MRSLNQQDHALVSKAIAAAEANSDGEIVAIAAEQSDAYHDVGLHYAVLAAFATLAIFAAAPDVLMWWHDLFVGWLSGGWSAEPGLRETLTWVLLLTLAKFLAVLFVMKWRPLRMLLTPGATRTRRVRRRAIMLFKTGAERRTVGRTGILIYLSLAEHRAEIVADEAITHVTTPETWGEAMAAMLVEVKAGRPGEGIAAAVTIIGAVLAEHFPKSSGDTNEIPDKLIEL